MDRNTSPPAAQQKPPKVSSDEWDDADVPITPDLMTPQTPDRITDFDDSFPLEDNLQTLIAHAGTQLEAAQLPDVSSSLNETVTKLFKQERPQDVKKILSALNLPVDDEQIRLMHSFSKGDWEELKIDDETTRLLIPELESSRLDFDSNQRRFAAWANFSVTLLEKALSSENITHEHILLLAGLLRSFEANLHYKPSDDYDLSSHFGRIYGGSVYTPILPYPEPHKFVIDRYSKNAAGTEVKVKFGTEELAATTRIDQVYGQLLWITPDDRLPQKIQIISKFLDAIRTTDDPGELLNLLGGFYHTMANTCIYARGTAAITHWLLTALCRLKKIRQPPARKNLDCYALSLQQEEFIDVHFLPWMKTAN